jgi:hypothetical protein
MKKKKHFWFKFHLFKWLTWLVGGDFPIQSGQILCRTLKQDAKVLSEDRVSNFASFQCGARGAGVTLMLSMQKIIQL